MHQLFSSSNHYVLQTPLSTLSSLICIVQKNSTGHCNRKAEIKKSQSETNYSILVCFIKTKREYFLAPELQTYPHCSVILPSAFSWAVHKGKIIVVCNMTFLHAAEEKVLGIIMVYSGWGFSWSHKANTHGGLVDLICLWLWGLGWEKSRRYTVGDKSFCKQKQRTQLRHICQLNLTSKF